MNSDPERARRFQSSAIRVAPGATSARSCRRLLQVSGVTSLVSPVMLPPGRAMLGTKPAFTGIARGHHHDGDCGRRALSSAGAGGACRDDHVDTETGPLRRELGKLLHASGRRSNLDREVLTLDVSELPERLQDHLEEVAVGRLEEDPDSIDTPRLLRLGSERRGEDGSQTGEEDTSVHRAPSRAES